MSEVIERLKALMCGYETDSQLGDENLRMVVLEDMKGPVSLNGATPLTAFSMDYDHDPRVTIKNIKAKCAEPKWGYNAVAFYKYEREKNKIRWGGMKIGN